MGEDRNCGACRYFGTQTIESGAKGTVCLRYPPTAFNVVEREEVNGGGKSIWWTQISGFPPVPSNAVCGEWAPSSESLKVDGKPP